MDIIEHMLAAGRLALELSLYLMLPITVVMGGMMKALENKGLLAMLSALLSPITRCFGASGLSIIGLSKMLFVSSIAPIPTLQKLDTLEQDQRKLAASLALVLTLTQANVSFPMIAYGLDIGFVLLSSLVGGVVASAITYYGLTRHILVGPIDDQVKANEAVTVPNKTLFQSLNEGGMEGMKIAINMIPMLIITLFLMAILKDLHAIEWLTRAMAPAFSLLGLPEASALPVITKYIAGGTAYMGVMVDQIEQGVISAKDLNIIAGLASNPVDLVGITIFSVLGPRINVIFRYALAGACIGLLVRASMHVIWFS
ncbi:Spore maturation protein B [Marinomonas aquimarina]|uniref:Spore maturation protein B n=1 Tax=Marinomonas aquimarina TaxID=295068 RepID=A0A1A8TID7_9GAMM|nr:nucleoside recognition domain-containing protein [Marinomonas aquimarina]SBS32198.1 Spore maturation protein B [Marinomonas aquimarina]